MRFIYGVACKSNSFSFYFFQCTNPFYEYTIMPSTIDEQLSAFWFHDITNKAKDSFLKMCLGKHMYSVLLGIYLEMELLADKVDIHFTLLEIAKEFSEVFTLICTPTSRVWEFQLFCHYSFLFNIWRVFYSQPSSSSVMRSWLDELNLQLFFRIAVHITLFLKKKFSSVYFGESMWAE